MCPRCSLKEKLTGQISSSSLVFCTADLIKFISFIQNSFNLLPLPILSTELPSHTSLSPPPSATQYSYDIPDHCKAVTDVSIELNVGRTEVLMISDDLPIELGNGGQLQLSFSSINIHNEGIIRESESQQAKAEREESIVLRATEFGVMGNSSAIESTEAWPSTVPIVPTSTLRLDVKWKRKGRACSAESKGISSTHLDLVLLAQPALSCTVSLCHLRTLFSFVNIVRRCVVLNLACNLV